MTESDLNTSLPCCSMMVLAHRREVRKGKLGQAVETWSRVGWPHLAGVRGTGLWEMRGSTSVTTWKFEKERLSSWGRLEEEEEGGKEGLA